MGYVNSLEGKPNTLIKNTITIQVSTGQPCSLCCFFEVLVTGQPKRKADMAQTNLRNSVSGPAGGPADIMSPDGHIPFKDHETEHLSTGNIIGNTISTIHWVQTILLKRSKKIMYI